MVFQSCEGPAGPQGPPGQDGGIFVADAFEIEVDFNASNDYQVVEEYGFDVFPYDVVLTYILWEVDGAEIWRLVPQQVYFQDGILQYNYDFTDTDVRLFLDGTIDFATLPSEWTQGQVFRVVVVPAENVDARMDYSDYEATMKHFGISEKDFQKR
ncbi:hypothetical protein GCM10028791_20960 [Echinicola sediminis]